MRLTFISLSAAILFNASLSHAGFVKGLGYDYLFDHYLHHSHHEQDSRESGEEKWKSLNLYAQEKISTAQMKVNELLKEYNIEDEILVDGKVEEQFSYRNGSGGDSKGYFIFRISSKNKITEVKKFETAERRGKLRLKLCQQDLEKVVQERNVFFAYIDRERAGYGFIPSCRVKALKIEKGDN